MARHARMLGPALDLNKVRTSRHGSLRAAHTRLLFHANSGEHVLFALDSWADVAALAVELLAQIPDSEGGLSLTDAREQIEDWANIRAALEIEKAAEEA